MLHMLRTSDTPVRIKACLLKRRSLSMRLQLPSRKSSGACTAPGDNVPVADSSYAYSKQHNTKPTRALRLLPAHRPIN